MKKIFLLLVAMVTFLPCLFAEHIKFAVNGPEKRYNQIRIVNNTQKEDFTCKAYFLEERDGKFFTQEAIGVFHLLGEKSYDTCTSIKLFKNGMHIGITVPDEIGAFSYVVSYKNYPLFDIIEVSLFDEESPIGKEF